MTLPDIKMPGADYIAETARTGVSEYPAGEPKTVSCDLLPGLVNRHVFLDRLTHMMHAAGGEPRTLGVIVAELEQLRNVNDTLGREAGDEFLKEFATRLQETFGKSANLARIGGNRFAVAVCDLQGASLAFLIEKWIIDTQARPVVISGFELCTAFKVGIAFFPEDGGDAESLLHHAAAALLRAKDTVDTYLFHSPAMHARVVQRLYFESHLRKAVEENQFLLHYQPKVDLKTRRITGLEALMRWRNPEHGLVSPLDFIPVLEQTGLIVEVGRWVIEQVVADMRRWRAQGLYVPRVAVNISQVQVRQENFVATVLAALGGDAGENAGVDLEIAENLIMEDLQPSIEKLRQLRVVGMRIAMDDIGTGYSSLRQIARLPLDLLKIDRTFIALMDKKTESMAIVSTIINLAQALKIGVVAEGVETEEQAAVLASLGCDEAQGYLFGPPVPYDDIVALLARCGVASATGERAADHETATGGVHPRPDLRRVLQL